MISITTTAKAAIIEALKLSGANPGQGLRLSPGSNGFELETGTPGANDTVITHEGSVVVFFNAETSKMVGDAIIDVDEGPDGPSLTMRRTSSDGHAR
ncbi:MAG: hypothetical protein ACE5Q6_18650 [Dehalococcoidia bacterium]